MMPIIRMHHCGLPMLAEFRGDDLLWLIYALEVISEDWWEWASPNQWQFLTSP